MPVLNSVKGIYRGSALVKSVTVGTKKIWPSRTITGYRVVAEFEAGRAYIDRVQTQNGEQEQLNPYKFVGGLMIRAKGGSQMLPVTKIETWSFGWIYTDGNPKDIGIEKDKMCELLAPIYAD